MAVEDMAIMRPAQAHAKAQKRKVKAIHQKTARQPSPLWPVAKGSLRESQALRLVRRGSVLFDFAALLLAVLGAGRTHVALTLAGVLALATVVRTRAFALALATVAADAFDTGLRLLSIRIAAIGRKYRLCHEHEAHGRGQNRTR